MPTKVIVQTEQTVSVSAEAVLLDSNAEKIEEAIAKFNEAKALIKELEVQKAEAEAILREAMGDAKIGLIAGVKRIKIKPVTRTDINRKDLQEVFPEAYELCKKETSYTVLTAE